MRIGAKVAEAKVSPLAVPKEVAELLHTSVESLAQMRYKGNGPRFVKLGHRVYYRWSDVNEWINSNVMTRTDDRPGVA